QAMGIAYGLESMRSPSGISIVPTPGWASRLLTVVTLTAGTALIMWMGEQISEKGIGNGISLIILAGIVVRLPSAVMASYTLLYMGLIVFFAYFYTAIVFNPIDLADNMKKYGGFIPGVRPGKKTAEYIDRTLTRITLPGALFLALISVLPDYLIRWFNVPFYFGGTSLLIVVGVALDTVRQMESHLLMRNYEG